MKLPKYNLSYNTRDLIHSLAKSTCERKYEKSFNSVLLKEKYSLSTKILDEMGVLMLWRTRRLHGYIFSNGTLLPTYS